MDIGDDKELMAEFAEFKELLRRDLGQRPSQRLRRLRASSAANECSDRSGSFSSSAARRGSLERGPCDGGRIYDEPEEEREGGRRALFFAAAAVVSPDWRP